MADTNPAPVLYRCSFGPLARREVPLTPALDKARKAHDKVFAKRVDLEDRIVANKRRTGRHSIVMLEQSAEAQEKCERLQHALWALECEACGTTLAKELAEIERQTAEDYRRQRDAEIERVAKEEEARGAYYWLTE